LGVKSAQQSASTAHSIRSQLLVVCGRLTVTATQAPLTHARSGAHSLLAAQLSPRPLYRLLASIPLLAGAHSLATQARPPPQSRRAVQASPGPPGAGDEGLPASAATQT
jgi:hypothetical protein